MRKIVAGGGEGGNDPRGGQRCHNFDINLITRPRLTFKFVCFFSHSYILLRISVNPVPRSTRETNVSSFISVPDRCVDLL